MCTPRFDSPIHSCVSFVCFLFPFLFSPPVSTGRALVLPALSQELPSRKFVVRRAVPSLRVGLLFRVPVFPLPDLFVPRPLGAILAVGACSF